MPDFTQDFNQEVPAPPADVDEGLITDVPRITDLLPDGREIVAVGDVERCRDFCHLQGDNDLGFKGTCGLCSTTDVLNQFRVEVTENDVVHYARDHGLCSVDGHDASMKGGTYDWQQAQLLTDYGVPAHNESGDNLYDLADYISEGRGVIIEVNAGVLWNDPNYFGWGQANHAIVVTGSALDPATGDVVGYYINDSGAGQAGRFIDAATMNEMWVQTGGGCVITDVVK